MKGTVPAQHVRTLNRTWTEIAYRHLNRRTLDSGPVQHVDEWLDSARNETRRTHHRRALELLDNNPELTVEQLADKLDGNTQSTYAAATETTLDAQIAAAQAGTAHVRQIAAEPRTPADVQAAGLTASRRGLQASQAAGIEECELLGCSANAELIMPVTGMRVCAGCNPGWTGRGPGASTGNPNKTWAKPEDSRIVILGSVQRTGLQQARQAIHDAKR